MKPLPSLHISALAAGLLVGGLTAQVASIVPPEASFAEGHHSTDLPFGLPAFRTQILVQASSVGVNGAVLTGVRFRPDRNVTVTPQALPNVTVTLSHTSLQLGNLGTTFASNVTGPTTVVFQGTVQLPQPSLLPGLHGPAGWDIHVPFAQPYTFTVSQGNLLIDIVANNPVGTVPSYWMDAGQAGGATTAYGAPGDNQTTGWLNLVAGTAGGGQDPRLLVTGQPVEFHTTIGFTQPPGFLMLGLLPQAAPIDLTPFGAPTHSIYVDPLAYVAHSWQQSFIGLYSTVSLAVPQSPALVDLMLYGQSVLFDPLANAGGILTSHGVEVRIGDPALTLLSQQVDADDPALTDGSLLDFSFGLTPAFGAVPVLFEGTTF